MPIRLSSPSSSGSLRCCPVAARPASSWFVDPAHGRFGLNSPSARGLCWTVTTGPRGEPPAAPGRRRRGTSRAAVGSPFGHHRLGGRQRHSLGADRFRALVHRHRGPPRRPSCRKGERTDRFASRWDANNDRARSDCRSRRACWRNHTDGPVGGGPYRHLRSAIGSDHQICASPALTAASRRVRPRPRSTGRGGAGHGLGPGARARGSPR